MEIPLDYASIAFAILYLFSIPSKQIVSMNKENNNKKNIIK